MKIYIVDLMGGKSVTCSEEDVAKLLKPENQGARFIVLGGSVVNPASISSVRRNWEAREGDVEKTSDTLLEMLGQPKVDILK